MKHKLYSLELKIALIEEYRSRNVTIRSFAKEKDVAFSTFGSWLTKIKKYGQPCILPSNQSSNNLIDITSEVKNIASRKQNLERTFAIETKGMVLKFSLSDLKEVLEVISND